jgi:hypothetical protein
MFPNKQTNKKKKTGRAFSKQGQQERRNRKATDGAWGDDAERDVCAKKKKKKAEEEGGRRKKIEIAAVPCRSLCRVARHPAAPECRERADRAQGQREALGPGDMRRAVRQHMCIPHRITTVTATATATVTG